MCNQYHNAPICVFLHPGVEDAWKRGWSHTLDTLWNATNGDPGQKQQVFDKYLDYAIMASSSDSVGDLQFDIRVITTIYGIRIYVPPEFKFLAPTKQESVWTDITNDFEYYYIYTANSYDSVAPGWTVVTIGYDMGADTNLMIPTGLYHIRMFNLRAPEEAGLYHFKIFTANTAAGVYISIHPGNFPIAIVKTELNPAWVEATIQTGGYDAPPYVSGHVVAEGTTPEGRAVKGVAYWGPMEFVGNGLQAGFTGGYYKTYLFGLAAGTYTFTAEASGFNPSTTSRITLDPGQSYHLFISISKSPQVCVTIWSKHGTGAIPWHNLWQMPYGTNDPDANPNDAKQWRDILIDLYDSGGNLIGFWASNVFGTFTWVPDPRHSPAAYHGLATKDMALSNKLLGFHDEEAPHPEKTSFYACLVDNFDVPHPYANVGDALTRTIRGYPSTHWDGHVPWDVADYIAGFPKGDYTLESFVTGYIMDEADSWQRSFTITGSPVTLQFDLRRSNWIETSIHMPSDTVLSVTSTLGLTAEDAAGSERASVAWLVTTAMTADHIINGYDASGGTYHGGIVIEGWNAVFPNLYGALSREDMRKDYGLNPTASTHSAGTVSLAGNPYTIKMYLTDMGYPSKPSVNSMGFPIWNATGWYSIIGGDPQVSVFLCNSPTPLSFSIVNAKIWISLRSVDFEVPAHSRPWIFPGSEIYVDFYKDGKYMDTLAPGVYGLFQDPGMWLDGKAVHVTDGKAAGVDWRTKHNPNTGWQIKGVNYGDWATYHWNTGLASPWDEAFPFGVTPYDIDYANDAGLHEHLGLYYFGTDWAGAGYGMNIKYPVIGYYRSTSLPPGEYTYEAHTHGYIMRRAFPLQIPLSGLADIEADLIEGGQIRVCMDFYHEGLPIEFNGFVRVEVFNADNKLVGASIYGQAEPNIYKRQTLPAGYGTYLAYDPGGTHWYTGDNTGMTGGPAQAAGLGDFLMHGGGNYTFPSLSKPQRAYQMMNFYGVPTATWSDYPAGTDGYSARDNMLDMAKGDYVCFDVYGFYWYYGDAARTWAGGWPTVTNWGTQWDWDYFQPDSGLKGSSDIPGWEGSGGGLYTVKVWAFDPMGPNGAFESTGTTDDWNMYSMGWELTNIQVPWEGAVSVYVPMNNMAKLRGAVRWFDMFGNLRALPWAQIYATPGPATDSIPAYSSGVGAAGAGSSDPSGSYIMWLPAGSHDVSVSTSEAPSVWSSASPTSNAQYTLVVSDGWVGGGDTQLSGSGVPVPELPALVAPLAMFAVIAASVWLLRKRNLSAPLLMK